LKDINDAGLQEKLPRIGWLHVEHLAHEVLGHVPGVPPELAGGALQVCVSPLVHGQSCEAQPSCPPLGAINDRSQGRFGQLLASFCHQLACLIKPEGKVLLA
jgi:hypothetical protein